MKTFLVQTAILAFSSMAQAENLPARPTDVNHPGSASYPFTLYHETVKLSGRDVDFYAPAEAKRSQVKAPLVVFGHGQALGSENYQLTFEHLAKKGIAVVHPQYDTGFFDRNWQRMGQDYVGLTALAVRRYAEYVNPAQIIFSGHSKGGYVALVAAGLMAQKMIVKPAAIVVFAPAGFEAENLARIDKEIPVTIVYSDGDRIIDQTLVQEIYDQVPAKNKQFIQAISYRGTTPELKADHFFPLTKGALFGGTDGISPLHYYGVWPWLMGAGFSLQKNRLGERYLYGDEAADTGLPRLRHMIQRSW